MKLKTLVLAALLALGMIVEAAPVMAQDVGARERRQGARIRQGVRSGELTRREARRMRRGSRSCRGSKSCTPPRRHVTCSRPQAEACATSQV